MVNIIPNRADTMEQPDRKVRPVNKPPPLSSCHNRDADDFANASVGGFQPVDQHPENFPFTSVKIQPEADICSGCGGYILDRYVNVTTKPKDQQHQRELGDGGDVQTWHSDCLKCLKCSVALAPLDGNFKPTCYMRGDQPHCKACYQRLFGIKCARCSRVIHATDWVRRARQLVYHLACFACDSCKRQLSTGEEFALQEFKVLCKQHYMELLEGDSGKAHQKQKTKRVRTTFTEEQLQILQANFQIDSNPDGQDLERIAQITGLSKRVTQVWFQNSRARQKKYQGGKGKVHGGQPGGEPGCHGDMMMPDSPCSGNVSLSDSVTRELDDDVISDDCGVSSRCYDNASPVMDTTSSMESLHHHHA